MKTYLALNVALTLIVACAAPVHGEDAKQGYNAFRLVRTRNIFDPERLPLERASEKPRVQSAQAARPASLTLTGVMITPEKTLAFFSGTRAEFNKVLTVRDKIADFTLTGISSAKVELERDGKAITVAVGGPVPLDASITATMPEPSSKAAAAAPVPEAANDSNDLLRRMMERRKKEISQ